MPRGATKRRLPSTKPPSKRTRPTPTPSTTPGSATHQLDAPQEAIACFEQALEHDPSYEGAFFNLLEVTLDTEDRSRRPLDSRRSVRRSPKALRRSASRSKSRFSPRHRGDGAPASSHSTDALRVAFVCGPDRKFITDIEREIGKRHEVRTAYFDDKSISSRFSA